MLVVAADLTEAIVVEDELGVLAKAGRVVVDRRLRVAKRLKQWVDLDSDDSAMIKVIKKPANNDIDVMYRPHYIQLHGRGTCKICRSRRAPAVPD